MRAILFLIPVLLSSTACSSQADYAKEAGIEGDPDAVATAGGAGAEAVSVSEAAEKDGGKWEFEYSWPRAVSAQPELAKQLAAEKDRDLAADKAEWEQQLAGMKGQGECGGCRNHSYGKEWKVVADLPGWLSLSANTSAYTGGAHGGYGLESLVWDKTKKVSKDAIKLFQSPAALDKALGPELCDALNREREKRRGMPVDPRSDDFGFSACQPVDQSTVLVGSSNGKTFDRITVWYGPYVAGSYAEGAYELDFPMTAEMVEAVRPEYRGAFSVKR